MKDNMLRISGILLALCSAGCGNGKAEADAKPAVGISFTRDVQPILDANCVQCHMTGAAQGDLVLEDGRSYAALVGVQSIQAPMKRVAAGDPEASYLFLKLTGTHVKGGGKGSGMPMVEGIYKPLDARSVATVRSWIESGADNN